jgi:hypothetical protein
MYFRTFALFIILILIVIVFENCSEVLDPNSCSSKNTATICFQNKSKTNTTFDVVMDGALYCTLTPGQKSESYTVSATTHIIEFRVSGTNTAACSIAYPTLVKCTNSCPWSCEA